jgi:uncharacterized protein (TIGR02147 family)
MSQTPLYRQYLMTELERRIERNPRYSLRAFGRALGMSPGPLSELLAGKRIPSVSGARKILSQLGVEPETERSLLESMTQARQARPARRKLPAAGILRTQETTLLENDLFRTMSDWQSLAVLFLTDADGFRPDPQWIAGALGISPAEATVTVERLLRVGMLQRGLDGSLTRTHANLTTADKHRSTSALRNLQRQLLAKAADALENEPIEVRSNTAMTFAIDPDRIAGARALIEDFQQRLREYLQGGQQRVLYQMAVAVFPLQKSSTSSKRQSA